MQYLGSPNYGDLMILDSWYLENLACPRTHAHLFESGAGLVSPEGAVYPVVEGLPVLLRDDVEQTIGLARASLDRASGMVIDQRAPELFLESLGISEEEKAGVLDLVRRRTNLIDPVVSYLVGATNGIAYKHLIGKLDHYPIPPFPLDGNGQLLDLGCGWGRWTLAAAKRGFEVVGVDPSLGALMAARRVSRSLSVRSRYVCGDARFLPFRDASFDAVFSYSVLQHLSEPDVELVLQDIARVLRPGGVSLIQMPNRVGLRCLFHQVRRGLRAARAFEVRYWSMDTLHKTFSTLLGESTIFIDCFFSLGLQKSDSDLMPISHRALIGLSEVLKGLSRNLSVLVRVADSVFVLSRKSGESQKSVASIRYIR